MACWEVRWLKCVSAWFLTELKKMPWWQFSKVTVLKGDHFFKVIKYTTEVALGEKKLHEFSKTIKLQINIWGEVWRKLHLLITETINSWYYRTARLGGYWFCYYCVFWSSSKVTQTPSLPMTPRSHWTSAVDKGRKDQLPLGLYRLTNMSCQHLSSPFPMIYVKFNEPARAR